jgi:Zn-dependent protease
MFTRSYPLFSILGFRISIDLSWFLLAALIVWTLATGMFPEVVPGLWPLTYYVMGVVAALGMFASIVYHELAHSLVARYYDIKISGITLFIFGGVAELEDEPPTAKSEFLVAIAGPISSFTLAGILYLLMEGLSGVAPIEAFAVLDYLMLINLVLAIFNLLPAFPLDGGRMLRAALWWWQGSLPKATRIASYLGAFLGVALMGYGAYNAVQGLFISGMWQILIGYFIYNAAGASRRQMEVMEGLRGVSVRQLMRPPAPTLPGTLAVEEVVRHPELGVSEALFPVASENRLLGMVRPAALSAIPAAERAGMTLRDVAKPLPARQLIDAESGALKALRQLGQGRIGEALVLSGGQAVGVITAYDIFTFLDRHREREAPQRNIGGLKASAESAKASPSARGGE